MTARHCCLLDVLFVIERLPCGTLFIIILRRIVCEYLSPYVVFVIFGKRALLFIKWLASGCFLNHRSCCAILFNCSCSKLCSE